MNTLPAMPELLPCPFCRSTDIAVYPRTCDETTPYNAADRAFPIARCRDCGVSKEGTDWGAPASAIAAWNRRSPVEADGWTEAQREKARDAVAAALGDAYDCGRVWSAWGVGTMSQDDFYLISEDADRVDEIAGAVLKAIEVPPAPMPRTAPVSVMEVNKLAEQMWRGEAVPGRVLRFGGAVLGLVDAALAAPQPSGSVGDAARDVLAERRRQIEVEGWTPEHDDDHSGGAMAIAGAAYALAGHESLRQKGEDIWAWTGWAWGWWKPKDRRSNLVRAGALIIAEIERLDRAAIDAAAQGGGKT